MIGFLGHFNTGKTFLMSELIQKELKQGLNVKTEGFNIAI